MKNLIKFKPILDEKYLAFKSQIKYLKEASRAFHTTGAIAPSSKYLGNALLAGLKEGKSAKKILEIGCGNGSITTMIAKELLENQALTIVEINPHFCQMTWNRLGRTCPETQSKVQMICGNILDVEPPAQPFDHIICSLPFNNFDPDLVEKIFVQMFKFAKRGGVITFFEYLMLRKFRILSGLDPDTKLQKIEKIIGNYLKLYGTGKQVVIANIPPALVYYLVKK